MTQATATVKYNKAIGKFTADAVYQGGLFIGTGDNEIAALEELKSMLVNRQLGISKDTPYQVTIEF